MAKKLLKELVFKKTTKAEIESGTLPDGKFYIPTDDTVAFMSDLETKQDKGDYATNTALQQGLAEKQDKGDYATNTALTQGLAEKQDKGDYATNTALTQGLAEKQDKLTAGENITIDGTTISATVGSGLDIGDIIYTTRTDNELAGKVECNGAQYNFADVNGGDNNIQVLLEAGKLPYVSIGEFDSMVTEQGGCDSFGYGIDTKWAQWEAQSGYVYTKTEDYEVGDPVYDAIDGNIIGNITTIDSENRTYIVYEDTDGASGSALFYDMVNGPVDSTPYFKVPKKLGRVLVRSQKPTADNNYTWFNVYSDGWVEQGGQVNVTNGRSGYTVTLLIEMNNLNYNAITSLTAPSYTTTGMGAVPKTSTTINLYNDQSDARLMTWQVSGYANSAEYTKDKWNYQNVQVERPMVQLFNSATDEAVAQCTEVLSDVAGLKDMNNITSIGKETVVGWGMPDYSAGVVKTHNTLYQAETDGIVRLCIGTNAHNIQFRYGKDSSVSNVLSVINGTGVTAITGDFFVPKGTYYQTTGTLYVSSTMSNTIIFYPCKK